MTLRSFLVFKSYKQDIPKKTIWPFSLNIYTERKKKRNTKFDLEF